MKKLHVIKTLIVILILFIFNGCGILAHNIYSYAFDRYDEVPDDEFDTYIKWKHVDQGRYPRETVYFDSGGNTLQGFVYGESNSKGLVIISQGWLNTADRYLPLIMFFADNGWRVFAYNNTGVSGSEGESVRGLVQSLLDLKAALDYVNNSNALNNLPVMLLGHSWGGFAACAVLNFDYDIKAVVSNAGYNNGSDVIDKLSEESAGFLYRLISGRVRIIEKQLFGDAVYLTSVDGINNTNIPVMIIQSSDDDVIFADSISIYAHRDKITNPNAQIVFLDGENAAGHGFVFYTNEQREYANWAESNWKTYKRRKRNPSARQWEQDVNFDVLLANQLNIGLMERINEFFLNAMK